MNSDISEAQKTLFESQLYINETLSGLEFDNRVVADPNYPAVVHNQNLRILVIRENFRDYTNRNLADVAAFVKQGQVTIEKNKFGPPNFSFTAIHLNIWKLLRGAGSDQVVILPGDNVNVLQECGGSCSCKCDCKSFKRFGGIFAIELQSNNTVLCKNPDNESNNIDFINRK